MNDACRVERSRAGNKRGRRKIGLQSYKVRIASASSSTCEIQNRRGQSRTRCEDETIYNELLYHMKKVFLRAVPCVKGAS